MVKQGTRETSIVAVRHREEAGREHPLLGLWYHDTELFGPTGSLVPALLALLGPTVLVQVRTSPPLSEVLWSEIRRHTHMHT